MSPKKIIQSYLFLFVVAGLIILADQLSKAYIRSVFTGPEGLQMWAPWDWMLPYARILLVTNTGVAFGMFQGASTVFMILAMIVSVGIIYYFPRVTGDDWILKISMSMMLAGAAGNLIDRLTQNGKVTDFISVGNFPVFNVADSSITVGVIILIIGVWLQENRQKKAERARLEQEARLRSTLGGEPPAGDGHSG